MSKEPTVASESKYPDGTITVIIRDDSPMILCGDSPAYRVVRFGLTGDQISALELKCTCQCGMEHYESISKVILE